MKKLMKSREASVYYVVCIDILFCLLNASDCVAFISFHCKQYWQSASFIHFLYSFLRITPLLALLNEEVIVYPCYNSN